MIKPKIDGKGRVTLTVPNHNLQRDIIRWDRECWDATILLLALESMDYEQFTTLFNNTTRSELTRTGGPSKTQFLEQKQRLIKWIHSLGHARCETMSELKMWEWEMDFINQIITENLEKDKGDFKND